MQNQASKQFTPYELLLQILFSRCNLNVEAFTTEINQLNTVLSDAYILFFC